MRNNTNLTNYYHHQKGLTLVEIMIAITLSLILLAGVLQIFISNKQTYRTQDAMARIQEGGRFGIHFLTSDIRMAGYMGCGSTINQPVNMVDLNGDGIPDEVGNFNGNGLQGYEYSAGLSVPLSDTLTLTAGDIVADTDVITIKRAAGTGVRLDGNMGTVNANIQMDPASAAGMFQANDVLFISDCEYADIFAANNVSQGGGFITIAHSNSVNVGNFLSTTYNTDAEVMRMINVAYYLAPGESGEPSLFRYSMGNNGVFGQQELVEGVEDMQITYGEDTDNDRNANVYVTADGVADWTQVVSVRIDLTVRSTEDNVASDVSAEGDYRLRRDFATTITIRNRVV